MWSSVAKWVFGSAFHHAKARHMAARELRANPKKYSSHVDTTNETYEQYADRMSLHGEWGDHVALVAFANVSGWSWIVRSGEAQLITIKPYGDAFGSRGLVGAIDFDVRAEHYGVLDCDRHALWTAVAAQDSQAESDHNITVEALLEILLYTSGRSEGASSQTTPATINAPYDPIGHGRSLVK